MNKTFLLAAAVLAAGGVMPSAAAPEKARRGAEKSFERAAEAPLAEARKHPAPETPTAVRTEPKARPMAARRDDFLSLGRDRGWGRDVDCRGYDRGWEEHWGGHGGRGTSPSQACDECKRRHGGCTYRCTAEAHRCWAQWETEAGVKGEYEGRTRRDRYDAEDDAVDRCRDDNWHNREQGRCRVKRCESVDETVDSGRC